MALRTGSSAALSTLGTVLISFGLSVLYAGSVIE
jgi:hypothetical protein